MKFAILRTKKLKNVGTIAAASAHNSRIAPVSGSAKKREQYNELKGAKNARQGVLARISDMYPADGQKPRKNAVLAVETVLTASPEFFDEVDPDWRNGQKPVTDLWIRDNIKFLKDFWGEKNIVQIAVHFDESTPHIHAITVPEKDGKLNCRAILGGKEKLSSLQDKYAEAMTGHGLSRGLKNSKSRHIPIDKFHNKETPKVQVSKIKEHRGFLDNPEIKVVKLTKNNVNLLKQANSFTANKEIERRARLNTKKAEKLAEKAEKAREDAKRLEAQQIAMQAELSRLKKVERAYLDQLESESPTVQRKNTL